VADEKNRTSSFGRLRGSASVTVERYRITAKDARGQVTGMNKGGIDVSRTYSADSGRLQSIYAQNQLAVTIQDFAFVWDVLGNLTDKVDSHRALSEQYDYDALNRLTSVSGSSSLSLTYDGLGNIATKSDVGTYSYGSKPHAVTSDGSRTYSYDGNGNLISGTDGRTNSYTVFNKPYAMSRAGSTVTIDYGPNRERYRRLDNQGGQVTVTHYVGSIEKITRPGPVIEIKHYLDGEAIETISGSSRTTQYLFTDHLGSVAVITNASGSVVQPMAFDAFGRRRDAVDYDAFTDPMIFGFDTTKTTRGFTFHEQLDPVGLIHMNGRVVDPTLGRFLSPDPFVQDPSNTQSLNRYSYVFNNPLSATDPSGYLSLKEAAGIVVGAVVSYYVGPWAGNWVAGWGGAFASGIGNGIAAGAITGAAAGATSTVAMGGSASAAFRSAGYGALSGAVFGGVASKLGADAGFWKEVGAYGVAGGVVAELQGGSFGHGFITAGLAAPLSGELSPVFGGGDLGVAIASVLVGGTLSEATGGRFVNGAATAALQAAVRSALPRGYATPHEAAMAAYIEYEELYFSLGANLEFTGVIYEVEGSYYYSEPVVVGAAPGKHSLTFDLPEGVTEQDIVAAYHTHPVGGGLYFSNDPIRGGDVQQVVKDEGTPIYLRNEIGDVRVLTRENLTPLRMGDGICGGRGAPSCLRPHPDTKERWRLGHE
jgi:RHS repeat-associated protein